MLLGVGDASSERARDALALERKLSRSSHPSSGVPHCSSILVPSDPLSEAHPLPAAYVTVRITSGTRSMPRACCCSTSSILRLHACSSSNRPKSLRLREAATTGSKRQVCCCRLCRPRAAMLLETQQDLLRILRIERLNATAVSSKRTEKRQQQQRTICFKLGPAILLVCPAAAACMLLHALTADAAAPALLLPPHACCCTR